MSYSLPNRRTYIMAAPDVTSCKGPKGKEGRLIDIHVSSTTAFTAGTVKVGTGADDDAYASFAFGTLADTDSACGTDLSDTDWLIQPVIPADTQVELTYANGGAGAGLVTVTIDWAD